MQMAVMQTTEISELSVVFQKWNCQPEQSYGSLKLGFGIDIISQAITSKRSSGSAIDLQVGKIDLPIFVSRATICKSLQ